MLKGLNWIGVIAALVVAQAASYLWYAVLFVHQLTEPMAPASRTPIGMVEAALLSLIMLIGVAWVIKRTGHDSLVGGVGAALILWFCFPFTGEAFEWLYMGRSVKMFEIDAGYTLLLMLLSGALIGGLKIGQTKSG
jgi:hypothetical protein